MLSTPFSASTEHLSMVQIGGVRCWFALSFQKPIAD